MLLNAGYIYIIVLQDILTDGVTEMDDVEITDVEEENSPFLVEKAPLDNQDLSSVSLLGNVT